MQYLLQSLLPLYLSAPRRSRRSLSFVSAFVAVCWLLAALPVQGQIRDRIAQTVDPSVTVVLPNHHPQWARPANITSHLADSESLDNLTLVLARSPEQEKALQSLLAQQQDLKSPLYHHWLTPIEMGARFGASAHDLAAITGWLQSQGLHVRWVSPSHTFIGFGGTAGTVANAFHTTLNNYATQDEQGQLLARISVATDPHVPAALAPSVRAITGLYTVIDHPLHTATVEQSAGPRITSNNGNHYITPADFVSLYDNRGLPASGQTIAIVGESRTNLSDFSLFRQLTLSQFPNPLEIVPTAYGGVDPGPAYAVPPTTPGVSLGLQSEATLDVDLAGSVAIGVQQPSLNFKILLVVATPASGGVEADAQYVVQSTPVPAQVLSISFGSCESSVGPAGVSFWDTLFQQAAAEGISTFVSSGDSGASGCDADFTTPPTTPLPNSPNYICSSSYATCVGGTEFNDTSNPTLYWSPSNGSDLESANGHIPEGAWNQPLNSSNGPRVAASGGGVSKIIPTPSWQTGPGVPAERTGRYTPDVAFSAASHDGYFACFAAAGASCVANAQGVFQFYSFAGTSAAAPDMAGVAARLNSQNGAGQGNLNPQLYPLASVPNVYYDVTVDSSGVTNCAVTTPSMCNNSIPGATAVTSAQPGYLVTPGYDLVTGLGSLDINSFLLNYPRPPQLSVTPLTLTFPTQVLNYPDNLAITIANGGSETLDALALAITGPNASDFTFSNNCLSSLQGNSNCSAGVTFTPTAAGTRSATLMVTASNAAQSPQAVALTGGGTTTLYTPVVNIGSSSEITVGQGLPVSVAVTPPQGVPLNGSGPINPLGSVVLTGGNYSANANLVDMVGSGSTAMFNIPGDALPIGNDPVTVTYTPSQSSASLFSSATGVVPINVTPVPIAGFTMASNAITIVPGQYSGNDIIVAITTTGAFSGSIALTAALTSSPLNAQHLPTFSFAPNPVTASGGSYPNPTLTVTTTAAGSNVSPTRQIAAHNPGHSAWFASGAASLAWLLLLVSPTRIRRWRAALNLLLLLLIFTGGLSACGGGGGGTTAPKPPSNPGTTPGTYAVTLTGTSGTLTATCTTTITVK